MLACKDGDSEIVQTLLKYGANIYLISSEGWTALFFAIVGDSLEITKLLIEKGSPIDTVIETTPNVLHKNGRIFSDPYKSYSITPLYLSW